MIDVVVKTEYKFALHAPDCALHLENFDDAISATKNIDYKIYTIEEQLIFLHYLFLILS